MFSRLLWQLNCVMVNVMFVKELNEMCEIIL